MSQLVSVQGQMYKELCSNAQPRNDDDNAFLKTHGRASKANRPQYIIQRTCLSRLERLQQGVETAPADPAADGDNGSEPDTPLLGPGTPLLNRHPAPESVENPTADPLTLVQAIRKLDPSNDEHWTNAGLPAMDAVEFLFGKNVNRGDVEAAAPSYDREAAQNAAE